jgi:hypothetical protein
MRVWATITFRIALRPHRSIMSTVAHVDSSGIRMNDLQSCIVGLQPPGHSFFSFRFCHSFLSGLILYLLDGKSGSDSAR